MKPNFMDKIANIITEIRNRSRINDVDTEVIEAMLKDALIEYHNEVFTYGHNIGYDNGYDAGHEAGKSILVGDVESAYDEGYSLGYDDGYEEGYALGYDDGASPTWSS